MSKHHEDLILKHLNKTNKFTEFKAVEDIYSSYDIGNSEYMIEIKWRLQHYPDQIMEELKFHRNLKIAKETNRDFIYLVRTTVGCFVWNISGMVRSGYDFKWFMKKLPATTDFNRTEWIDKSVTTLKYEQAKSFTL